MLTLAGVSPKGYDEAFAQLLPQAFRIFSNLDRVPMPNNSEKPGTHAHLRQKAEVSLRGGSAPVTQGWTIGSASLTLLHRLAGDPVTASDALKLLHELQVHQVELDLQHEHMNEERQVLEQSMQRLVELFVCAPVAYFMVTVTGQVVEGNAAGARMLGVARDDVDSLNITRLVAPGSRAALLDLLEQANGSGLRGTCRVEALDADAGNLVVIANASPGGQHCLVMIEKISNMPPTLLVG